jgi:hypothetical protein
MDFGQGHELAWGTATLFKREAEEVGFVVGQFHGPTPTHGLSGFFTFSQHERRPERYGAVTFFETTPCNRDPVAFAIVGAYALLWLIFEWSTFDWHAVATLATWFMTLFIQRAEYRDTQTIHAKLDELLLSHGEARTELRAIDDDEPEEIERHRAEVRSVAG